MRIAVVLALTLAGCSDAVTNGPLPDFAQPTGDGGGPRDFTVALVDLAPPELVVNEAFPGGSDPLTDPDWIELKNPTNVEINLSSYTIADSSTTAPLPDEVVPAGGYVLILCDDVPDGGAVSQIHVPFKLSQSGDEVHLKQNGNGIDKTSWGKNDVPDGKSWARIPDGTGPFQAATPTRLGPNMP